MEEKIRLYLEKGALEVWIVDLKGKVSFYSHTGKIKKSNQVESFKL
jgi:Uma2 family endonuclease